MKTVIRKLIFFVGIITLMAGFTAAYGQGTPESVLRRAQGLLEAYKAASDIPPMAPTIVGNPDAFKSTAAVLFSDNFESGAANWTIDADTEWEVGAPTYSSGPAAHGGANVIGTNLDGAYAAKSGSITSKKISLTGTSDVIMAEFYLWYKLYYDYIYCEISSDDGQTWTNILPATMVPYGYIYDYEGYTSYKSSSWNKVVCDLTAYKGQNVQIRIRNYFSYGAYSEEAGVYVDDFSINAYDRGNPVLRIMPAYYTWPGKEAIVWGSVTPDNSIGSFAGATYTWDFGDGTPETGTVTDPNFIKTTHTYLTAGTKTATLTIDTGVGAVQTKTVKINVNIDNLETRRLKAIEDGLRWLYTQARTDGSIGMSSEATSNMYGITGANILAFLEQGHLATNDQVEDIYAPIVKKGLSYNVNNALKYVFNNGTDYVPVHPGNPDTNDNGYGMYLGGKSSSTKYQTGLIMLGIIASKTPNEVIQEGQAAGLTYKQLIQEVIDYLAYTQSDTISSARGGWQYEVYNTGYSDNSATQWPALGMMAAEHEWGCYVPQWVKDETAIWLANSQSSTEGIAGGFGYTSADYWTNIAKTGAGLCGLAFLGKTAEDPAVTKALGYLNARWGDTTNSYDGHMNDSFYALYAVAKGCRVTRYSNGDQISSIGTHNWWNEYVNFLVNDPTYSQDAQYDENGKWYDEYWSEGSLSTALSILVLSPGVFTLPPVAVITGPEGSQPGVDVEFSGAKSYHQDISKSVVEWIWDYDKSDGIKWDSPDAVGQNVIKTGGWTTTADIDTIIVTLRVKDNSIPAIYDTEEHMIIISKNINHPPIAIAGGPYSGRPGVAIQLDGTGSYDPDPGDAVVKYEWDLNGDGLYDDSTLPNPVITWNSVQEGVVGLKVFDKSNLSSSDKAPVYVKIWTSERDLAVSGAGLSITNDKPSAGETVTLTVNGTFSANDNASSEKFIVRFYNGNPDSSYILIGDYELMDIIPGSSFSASVNWTVPTDYKSSVWVKLDALDAINEYDETNNLSGLNIGTGGNVLSKAMLYFEPDPARLLGAASNIPTIVSLSVKNAIDLFGANINITFDKTKVNVVSMTPGDFFSKDADEISSLGNFDNAAGNISIQVTRMGGNLKGVTGTGSIMDIKFKAVADDPSSQLTFSTYSLDDSKNEDIEVESADNGEFVGIGNLLGDFDSNTTVDFVDYTQFIVYWNANNMSGDMVSKPGKPNMAGSAPWSKEGYLYRPEGVIDYEDQIVFAIMYNWYKSVTAEKSAAKIASALKETSEKLMVGINMKSAEYKVGDTFIVSFNPGAVKNLMGAGLTLSYSNNNLKVRSVTSGSAINGLTDSNPVIFRTSQGTLTASSVLLGGNPKGLDFTGGDVIDIEFEVTGEGVYSVKLVSTDVRNYLNMTMPLNIDNPVVSGKIGEISSNAPQTFGLMQNYPNPFNMSTTIAYKIDKPGKVEMVVYNSIGQIARTLISEFREPGQYTAVWNGTADNGGAVTSGVYIVKLKQGMKTISKQMLLIK